MRMLNEPLSCIGFTEPLSCIGFTEPLSFIGLEICKRTQGAVSNTLYSYTHFFHLRLINQRFSTTVKNAHFKGFFLMHKSTIFSSEPGDLLVCGEELWLAQWKAGRLSCLSACIGSPVTVYDSWQDGGRMISWLARYFVQHKFGWMIG